MGASRTKTDEEGNLILEVGPDRDPVMFIAHLDEVGFEVTNIAADGVVSLRIRGGLFPSLWEGQQALLHFDDGKAPLRGVFVPRRNSDEQTARSSDCVVWRRRRAFKAVRRRQWTFGDSVEERDAPGRDAFYRARA